MAADADPSPDREPIEWVDWDRLDTGRSVPRRLVGLFGALAVVAALYRYSQVHGTDLFLPWSPSLLTWAFRVSLVVLAFLGLPPLVANPERARRYWRRFRRNRLAVASLGYLVAFVVLALVGPVVFGRPKVNPGVGFQPPAFFTVSYGTIAINCVGPVTGTGINPICVGTLRYPLGTTKLGENVLVLLIAGMRVSLQVAVVATAFMIPVATTVGIVSGYVGGRLDTALMRYVDVQQAVPAFVVYLVLVFVFGKSLFLLVAVFGLLNWGSVARLVRSEVLRRREEQYVEVAESAGVSRTTVLRRHLLPNVSNAVLVGATQKIPQLVLIETGVTFLGLGDVGRRYQSFGETIADGFDGAFGNPALEVWWIWVLPVVVLAVTIIAFAVVGDALRDAFDPRGEV
ncbi:MULTISPECIES: ABC transporter permease [Halorussus]|uniref:ABC transporter permease n=1 Tax=Halorussus TaxID=1070314 RepID=UPI00209CE435|nr:ABC transporter permease [Halorussus vallis]USZ74811.1 ABC transporter permease [Halorussus vallis]